MLSRLARACGWSACLRLFFLLVVAVTGPTPVFAGVDDAEAYLLAHQNADGSITGADDIATRVQATSEALGAASLPADARAAALDFLDTSQSGSIIATEYLARLLVASGDTNLAALAELQARQNADGSFGHGPGATGNLSDTAFALGALVHANLADSSAAQRAVGYLLNARAGGRWSGNAGTDDAALSLQIWHALYPFRHQVTGVADVLDAVVAQWGSPFAEDFMEAQRLHAVMLRSTAASEYHVALQAFAARQQANGSFSGDVYTTSLALHVLSLSDEPFANPDLASVRGRVVDAEYGTALSGARVTLGDLVTATDAQGRFSFDVIAAGNAALAIQLDGFSGLTADIQLARGQALDLGDLGMLNTSASGAILRGVVQDASSGAPISGARVALDTGAETVTESEGRFTFSGLESGSIGFTVRIDGYETVRRSAVVEGGSVHLVSVVLSATGSGSFDVRGQVTDAQTGAPLADVTVVVEGDANAATATGVNGGYELAGLPTGYVTLEASKAGYCTASAFAQPRDGQRLAFSPALESESSCDDSNARSGMTGIVRDVVSGMPVTGATVTITSAVGSETTTSDNDGRFELFAAAGDYELTVTSPGYRTALRHVAVSENLVVDYGVISVSPEGYYPSITLSGTVLDSVTGAPLPGASVAVVYPDGETVAAPGADGKFVVAADGEREVVIRVLADGYQDVEWGARLPAEDLDVGQLRLRPEGLGVLRPDITLTLGDLSNRVTDPQTLRVSGAAEINVHNIGRRHAERPFDIVAFADQDGDGAFSREVDREVGRAFVGSAVAADSTSEVEVALSGILSFRDAPIHFIADPGNQLIESRDDNNSVATLDACRVRPDRGTFIPVEKWRWSGGRVSMTPLAAPLVDSNGDGVVDVSDDIYVVFVASSGFPDNASGVLVAVNGRTGEEFWRFSQIGFDAPGQLAVGDIDADGFPEILGTRYRTGLIAVNGDGSLKWQSEHPTYRLGLNYGGPALADIDGDGTSEIVIDRTVLNSDGTLRWVGSENVHGSRLSVVADIDLDGEPEIIVGSTAYDADGNLLWRADVPEGKAAVGNFDDDPYAEIIIGGSRQVHMLSHEGDIVWGPVVVTRRYGAGAATIGDVNGDGIPEIGIAGDNYYHLFNSDGSKRWTHPIRDLSSNTGSTFFDFDGDNRIEAVYADERYLRVFDGNSGEVVFQVPNRSVTAFENPIVADVDADSHAELVVPSYDYSAGIRVFEDAADSWVNVRRIWNQHGYHITNINDDMSIPAVAGNNWESYNNFRVNAVPDPTRVADLTASLFTLTDNGPGQPLTATLRVGNGGGRDASDVVVRLYTADPASGGTLWAETVVPRVPAGEFVDVELDGTNLPADPLSLFAEVNSDGAVPECFGHNNSVTLPAIPVVGSVSVGSDAAAYAPDQAVAFSAVVENTGSFTRAFTAQLQIEDAAGNIVTEFAQQALGELSAGEQRLVEQAWNTGRLLSGDYQVRALLYSPDAALLDDSFAPFTIAHDAQSGPLSTMQLATDRIRYHTTDQVRFSLRAVNESVSTLLPASSIRLTVTDPFGDVAFEKTLAVRQLGPANAEALVATQVLQAAPIGNYTVTAAWTAEDGALLAASERTFEVFEDLSVALQGTVTVAAPEIYVGDSQLCTASAVNSGTRAANVDLRHTVARLDQPQGDNGEPYAAQLEPDVEQSWIHAVQTSGMSEGDYACILEAAIDGEWRPLANAFFRLEPPPIRINASMAPGERGRVLVLLDPACADVGEEGECDMEPHGPDFAPSLPVQREHLEAVLANAGWTYTIVTSSSAFEAEFRSKGYELYALFNEAVKLPEALQHEIVDDIASGRGLLVSGNHDRRNGRLEEALGIKSLGKNLEVESLVTVPFGDHDGGEIEFNVAHWPNALRLEGAEVLGEFRLPQKGKKPSTPEPALTRNAHEEGAGTYAAFDWPAQSAQQGDDGELAGLLTASLDVTHPDPYGPVAGRVISLELVLQNEGMATPGEVHFALPPDVALVSGPEGASVADRIVRWPFMLNEAEHESATLWLQLPETAGPLTFEAVIQSGEGDSLTEHVRAQTVLNVLPQE